MKYFEFYNNSKRRTLQAILSMFASGKPEYQTYLKYILENEENIFAEPVFQPTFPWESSELSFKETKYILDIKFIKSLDNISNGYRFPLDQHPYKHQINSWDILLNQKKSIVVTSGTGSGKTECFMIPVLQDLIREKKNNSVQAIFLYPLNALIGSQKKRIDTWCKALGGDLRYAIYNGKTPESVNIDDANAALPELLSRNQIRNTPPQILFTNPTMLEYMMVRGKDKTILDKSQGQLRWILLDEAHTYTGSAAAEIALLIRRILDSFGVTIDQVRFAATSATIGDTNAPETYSKLKTFMSKISGHDESRIEIITGNRVLPTINESTIPQKFKHLIPQINRFRNYFVGTSALLTSEISKRFKLADPNNIDDGLKLIDDLGETIDGLMANGEAGALVPTRGNFFARGIDRILVCINPNCTKHHGVKPNLFFGSITTHTASICECGTPLLELVQCEQCGEFLAKGEHNVYDEFRLEQKIIDDDLFDIEDTDNDSEDVLVSSTLNEWYPFVLGVRKNGANFNNMTNYGIDETILVPGDVNGKYFNDNNRKTNCPHCGASPKSIKSKSIGATFLNRLLSSTLLEQAPPVADDINMQWQGRRFIAFTDSRQGTAKINLLQNIETERLWLRSRVFHFLSENYTTIQEPTILTEGEKQTLDLLIANNLQNEIRESLERKLHDSQQKVKTEYNACKWATLEDKIFNDPALNDELRRLHNFIVIRRDLQYRKYLKWLLYDEFLMRAKRDRKTENLGFIKCVYPALANEVMPNAFRLLNESLTNQDWKNFLKICIDFYIRENRYVEIPTDIYAFRTSTLGNTRIYPHNSEIVKDGKSVHKWITFDKKKKHKPHRLILLLCAAANWTDANEITAREEDIINEILKFAFNRLISKSILTGDEYRGYALNLENSMSFEIVKDAWLCPITQVALDVTFCGYSPRISGELTAQTFNNYKITEDNVLDFPLFTYANKKEKKNGETRNVSDLEIVEWSSLYHKKLIDKGFWSDFHERILLRPSIYFSGEHSAQQNSDILKKLEESFEKGRVNILTCSTTMEMGVDIGGISEVVMNNVPPSPANYLQRAGRAGRRNEAKALALTFCAPNPVGRSVMDEPKSTLSTDRLTLPLILFNSPNIVQRHINSLLFGAFIRSLDENLHISESVEKFFISPSIDGKTLYEKFLIFIFNQDSNSSEIEPRLKSITKETSLSSQKTSSLLRNTYDKIAEIQVKIKSKIDKLEEQKLALRNEGFEENSPAIISLNYKLRNNKNQNLLGYLADNLFLPNANLPTGVVEFDKNNRQIPNNNNTSDEDNPYLSISNKENPSFSIVRALADYAPGKEVIINQWSYKSAGIQINSTYNPNKHLKIYKCSNGHVYKTDINLTVCPAENCNKPLTGVFGPLPTEAIEPVGFSVDFNEEPTRKPNSSYTFSIIEPEIINVSAWSNINNQFAVELRSSNEDGEIMYYNKGNGYGYAVCIHCGRAIKESGMHSENANPLQDHKHLQSGQTCTGNDVSKYGTRRNVLLIGGLQTDFVELRFSKNGKRINDESFLRTMGVILSQTYAKLIGINTSEIGYGLKNYSDYSTLYLFDTARGGAGYSSQLQHYILKVFDAAKNTLNCNCVKACTKCLINRESQWYFESLDRKLALNWLEWEFENRIVIPESIKMYSSQAQKVSIDFPTEFKAQLERSKNAISSIFIFIDGSDLSSPIESWNLYSTVKRLSCDVNFLIFNASPTKDYETMIQLSSLGSLFQTTVVGNIFPLAIINFADSSSIRYFSELSNNIMGNSWSASRPVYCDNKPYELKKSKLEPQAPDYIRIAYIKSANSESFNIFNLLMSELGEFAIRITKAFMNSKVSVTYSDKYVNSKLSSIILLQFILQMKRTLNLDIEEIKFSFDNLESKYGTNDKVCYRVHENWNSNKDRKNFIKSASHDLGIDEDILELDEKNRNHYRMLEIKSGSHILIIQPDGGIAYGWQLRLGVDDSYEYFEADSNIPLRNKASNGIQYIVKVEDI